MFARTSGDGVYLWSVAFLVRRGVMKFMSRLQDGAVHLMIVKRPWLG